MNTASTNLLNAVKARDIVAAFIAVGDFHRAYVWAVLLHREVVLRVEARRLVCHNTLVMEGHS